jgi:hypothetical protein
MNHYKIIKREKIIWKNIFKRIRIIKLEFKNKNKISQINFFFLKLISLYSKNLVIT